MTICVVLPREIQCTVKISSVFMTILASFAVAYC